MLITKLLKICESMEFCGNYAWPPDSVIGTGFTGKVYRGFDVNTGEEVAVKTFENLKSLGSQPYHKMMQHRQFEILKKVDHENVIKVLSLETKLNDSNNTMKVMVMEYCNNGSLREWMNRPANRHGLPQSEFLLVLKHLTAGMKHLREKNFVHRDLKPGNIMRHVTDSGNTIYKLADFDSACELDEDQSFTTIFGTVEYLSPEIFAMHFKKADTARGHVDLWSIGAIIYHTATGCVPFQLLYNVKGIERELAIYDIVNQKDSGVISGLQYRKDGPIEWSDKLPEKCHLSSALKALITPLIAGLMEKNDPLTFDQFFNKVDEILCKRVVHIFCVNTFECLELWIDANATFNELKNYIKQETQILNEDQILILNNDYLENIISDYDTSDGGTLPATDIEHPIFLFSQCSMNKKTYSLSEKVQKKCMDMPETNDTDKVLKFVRTMHLNSYDYNDWIEEYLNISSSIAEAIKQYRNTLKTRIKKLQKKAKDFQISLGTILHFADLAKMFRNCNEIREAIRRLTDLKEDFNNILKFAEQLDGDTTKLQDDMFRNIFEAIQRNNTKINPKEIRPKVSYFIDEINIAHNHFKGTKTNPSALISQFQTLIKKKIFGIYQRLEDLLFISIQPEVDQSKKFLSDWYGIAQAKHSKILILHDLIVDFERKLNAISIELYNLKRKWKNEIKNDSVNSTLDLTNLLKALPEIEAGTVIDETNRLIILLEEMTPNWN